MLELKRNLNFKSKFDKQIQTNSRIRKIFKNKSYFLNPTFLEVLTLQKSSFFSKKLDIRITPNNVFCTLKDLSTNTIVDVGSSGKYQVKTSKKTLRFSCKIIINFFLEQVKYKIKSKKILVNLTGPIRLRKVVLEQIAKYIGGASATININQKKCFNGCRPQKKRRKKQKGLRIFK